MGLLALLAVLAPCLQGAPPEAPPKVLVLRGAKVFPVSSPPLDGALVILSNGRISAVGKDVVPPPGAATMDLSGKVLIPGLIDAASRLLVDSGERGPGAADMDVLDALDRYDARWREVRERGVTCVFLLPGGSGSVGGLGAVLRLDEARSVLQKESALCLAVPGGETSSPAQRHDAVLQLRRLFESGRQYAEAWTKYRKELAEFTEKSKAPEPGKAEAKAAEPAKPRVDTRLERVARALDPQSQLLVRVEVHAADALRGVLSLAADFKLRLVIEGATEGEALAADLAKAGVPVVAGPSLRYGAPDVDQLRHEPGLAGGLSKAGVRVAIGSFLEAQPGGGSPSRFMAEFAALAVAGGLPRELALSAVTWNAARALGVEKEIGSIEAGRRGDLVVLSGDPFEPGTRVERVLVGGETVFQRKE